MNKINAVQMITALSAMGIDKTDMTMTSIDKGISPKTYGQNIAKNHKKTNIRSKKKQRILLNIGYQKLLIIVMI